MRKSTLATISFLIGFPIVYFSRELLPAMGVGRVIGVGLASNFFLSLVLAPFIALVLTPLNRRLLQWRKARGRDIEEEERYESDHGFISLTPRDEQDNKHELER